MRNKQKRSASLPYTGDPATDDHLRLLDEQLAASPKAADEVITQTSGFVTGGPVAPALPGIHVAYLKSRRLKHEVRIAAPAAAPGRGPPKSAPLSDERGLDLVEGGEDPLRLLLGDPRPLVRHLDLPGRRHLLTRRSHQRLSLAHYSVHRLLRCLHCPLPGSCALVLQMPYLRRR